MRTQHGPTRPGQKETGSQSLQGNQEGRSMVLVPPRGCPPRSRSKPANEPIGLKRPRERSLDRASTYEIERLEVVTGRLLVSRPTPCHAKGPDIGVAGRWREPRSMICGRAMTPRARVSQRLPGAFTAFTKINDLQARPFQKMPRPSRFF